MSWASAIEIKGVVLLGSFDVMAITLGTCSNFPNVRVVFNALILVRNGP